jgi:hypothetical protein
MSEEKKVAVFTALADLPRSYGLVPVILNQLDQLVQGGWKVDLYTQAPFNKNHPDAKLIPMSVNLCPDVPFVHIYDYTPGTPAQTFPVDGVGENGEPNKTNYVKQVKLLEDALEPKLSKYGVIITHDIIFQGWFVTHNQAIRNIAANNPDIKWIHWVHSGPSARPSSLDFPSSLRFTPFPNSVIVCPNKTMGPKFAEMYNMPINSIKTVYHTFDPIKFWDMHPWSVSMIKRYKLLDCDALAVWATRIDHLEGKGMFHGIHLLGQLNKLGNVKMLFLNSWSNHEGAKHNIRRLREEAEKWSVPKGNLLFSSEMGTEYELGVPKQVVRDLGMIGDMFIFPSQSETFSLSMVEMAAMKNMLMLNEDLKVLPELCGDRADYFKASSEWGGMRDTTDYKPSAEQYWMDKAHEFWKTFNEYKPLQQHRHVLKYYNNEWVFKNQLEPLLKGEW